MMKNIVYCVDKKSRKKAVLPFSCVYVHDLKSVYASACRFVVFEESFLNKNIDKARLADKLCFACFNEDGDNNLEETRKAGLFDYFTLGSPGKNIASKFKRGLEVLAYKEKIAHLEKGIVSKDKKIGQIVLLDPSSGCYNWRYFIHHVHQELSRAKRHLYNISFMGVDIDYFRRINEVYGVKVADSVIRGLVALIRKSLRKEDVLSRWRDDEFYIILPYISAAGAYKVAQRIKSSISAHKFRYKNMAININVSMGLVSFPEDCVLNTNDVVNAIGKCLTIAKRKGGNAVVFYSQPFDDASLTQVNERKGKADVDALRTRIDKMNSLLTRDLLEMIYGFARAIEAKDLYTAKHVESTAIIAEKIAGELKMPREEIENIKRAAVLHDLGKVGIDERILAKRGPLNKKEKEVIKTHPWIATEILRQIHALHGTIPAILYHHERYDGKGYPLGLKGEEIPLGARIVAVSDVYQALISNRPYRKAFKIERAIRTIKKESGGHFDPKVVDAFTRVIKVKNEDR